MDNSNGASGATISDEQELDTLRDGIDDPQVLKEHIAKETKARREITARAKRAEAELAALKAKSGEGDGKTTVTPPVNSNNSPSGDYIPKAELDLRLSGWSQEDARFILLNGGPDSLKDPNSLVSIALKAKKEQKDAEIAAAATTVGAGASEVERKYTADQLKSMTAAELEKILPHAQGQ